MLRDHIFFLSRQQALQSPLQNSFEESCQWNKVIKAYVYNGRQVFVVVADQGMMHRFVSHAQVLSNHYSLSS